MQEDWTLGEVKHGDECSDIPVGDMALSQKPDKDVEVEPKMSGNVPYLDKLTVFFGR